MTTICCLNNYPLRLMLERGGRGESPGQHAWGVDHLAGAHDVLLAPFHERRDRDPLARLSERLGWRLGQLDQEAWAALRRCDVIYSADQYSLRGLALLGPVVRRRLVSVLHHPPDGRRVIRRATLGHDHLACLSPRLADDVVALGMDRRAVSTVAWGPDLRSPLYRDPCDEGRVVSVGKSNRDLGVLVRALEVTRDRARVYDLDGQVGAAPAGVELIRPGGRGTDGNAPAMYLASAAIDEIRRAGVVAIPVRDTGRLTGLTELDDALALGKPVVMTHSPYMPVDVDAIGCGIAVEAGDVDGWVRAFRELSDPTVRAEMGARGRAFAERAWNYGRFCEEIEEVVVGPGAAPSSRRIPASASTE